MYNETHYDYHDSFMKNIQSITRKLGRITVK